MNKIKGIMFDIDDTLYSHKQNRIPQLTKYTIQKLKENGFQLGVCTSRFPREFCSLPSEIFELFDFVAAGTGSIFLENNQIVHIEQIDEKIVEKYIGYFEMNPNICYMWMSVDGVHFANEPDERTIHHQIDWAFECPTIQKWNHEPLYNLSFYNVTEKQMNEIYSLCNDVSIEDWHHSGQINPFQCDKAYGAKMFAKHFHLDMSEIACFGDGKNDISMIKACGMGICVGNGKDELKKQADHVCDTIENGGIYTFCVNAGWIRPIQSKIFFFDIDGTTYRHDLQIVPESTLKTIDILKTNGCKCCICTSRSPEEMIHLPKDYLDKMDGIICLAGGKIIVDNHVYLNEVDYEDTLSLIQFLNQEKIPFRYVCTDSKGYLWNSTPYVRGLFEYQYQMCPPEKEYENEKIIHLTYYPKDEKQNEQCIQYVHHSNLIHMNVSHEMTKNKVDKASSLEFVTHYYGYDLENSVAFGDGYNDVTMLQTAMIGIAMGNGSNVCQMASDYVTERIEEDGIEKACKHFNWIL
ncbi:MAG: HAD-IIB family hydrolase [Traorella sp.]